MSAYGPADFASEFHVSRENMERLAAFDDLLVETSKTMNLVARSTIDDRWERHFRDSAQLAAFAPHGSCRILDIGSGAGFPGLVLSALLGPAANVTLVESIRKKASFLEAAVRAMNLSNVDVRAERIEALRAPPADIVTARALAALPKLLHYAEPFVTGKTICIFPKGQDIEQELTEATKYWCMTVESRESLTRSGSQILIVRDLRRKSG